MYFIGSTDHRGTYYFYSQQHRGWIVADLDMGKASLRSRLALIRALGEDVLNILEGDEQGLGQDGDRWLVDGGNDLIVLLRDYGKEMEVLMVYYENGSERPYGKVEKEIAEAATNLRKEFEEKE